MYRVCMGHGTPGKSWNFGLGHGKSWKMKITVIIKHG